MSQSTEWLKGITGLATYRSYTDPFGNTYITGEGNSFIVGNDTITTSGSNIIIGKIDSTGKVIWGLVTQGGSNYNEGFGISADSYGNCFVTGRFTSTTIFGNDTLTTGSVSSTIFVAKIDSSGNFVWVKQEDDTSIPPWGGGIGWGIANTENGQCVVTGRFGGTISFGSDTLISKGGDDIFVAKYDVNGNNMWAKSAGGIGGDWSRDVTIDKYGNIYLTGHFTGQVVFEADTINAQGSTDIFVAKYDSIGNQIWVNNLGNANSNNYANSLSNDSIGNVYITGKFEDTIIFNSDTLISNGNSDIFIAKCDNNGNWLWGKDIGSIGQQEQGKHIITTMTGYSFVTGEFVNIASFDTINLIGLGTRDAFIVKVDPDGNFSWAKSIGGPGFTRGYGVGIDSYNNLYCTGICNDILYLDNDTLFPFYPSYIAKFSCVFDSLCDSSIIESVLNPHINNSFSNISIFPNPFSDKTYLQYNYSKNEEYQLMIYDLSGKLLREIHKIKSGIVKINRENLGSGCYLFKLYSNTGELYSGKLLIE